MLNCSGASFNLAMLVFGIVNLLKSRQQKSFDVAAKEEQSLTMKVQCVIILSRLVGIFGFGRRKMF